MKVLVTGTGPNNDLIYNNLAYPWGSIIDMDEACAEAYIKTNLVRNADEMTKEEIEEFQKHVLLVLNKRKEFEAKGVR